MSRGSSGHITAGGSGYFYHNDRSHDTKNSIFSDEKNEYSCTATEAMKLYRQELSKRTKAYTTRTNQKLQKNIATHRSMIINLEKHHTLKDLEKVKDYLEVSLDTKVLQIAIHRDEGYVDKETGKAVKNYHAHIEMMGIDSHGISIAQHQVKKKPKETKKDFEERAEKFQHTRANRLDSKFYTKLQTFLSNTLEMKRGERGSKAKRLDTYEYKREAEKIATEKRATIAKVKAQFKQEKQTLINSQKATQTDYTNLRKKYKELEEKARKKDLTIEALEKEVYSEKWKNKEKKPAKNKDVVVYLEKKLAEKPKEIYVENPLNTELQQKVENLETELEEKEEFLLVATETQEKFRAYAQTYQKKLSEAQKTIETQKTENVSLREENSSLRAIVSEISAYLKCKKDQIVEKVKNLFQKEDKIDEEFEKMMKDPKMQISEKTVDEKI